MSELISLLRNKLDMSSALVVPVQDQAIMIRCPVWNWMAQSSPLTHDVISPQRFFFHISISTKPELVTTSSSDDSKAAK